LRAYLHLTRPPESAIVFAATCVGGRIAGLADTSVGLTASLAASNMLLFAASTAFNDWHDVAEDRVNKPARPVASGAVSAAGALGLSLFLSAGALACAAMVGERFAILTALLAGASALYTLRLKRLAVVGNATVAVVSSYPLACWLLIAPPTALHVMLVLGCVALRMGGELVKTVEDAAGDSAAGVVTLATSRGAEFAGRAGLACLSISLAIGLAPLFAHRATPVYGLLLASSSALIAAVWMPTLGLGPWRPLTGSQLVHVERAVTALMTVALAFV
jgi:4-hydroxybenzoate polyprenyltransferase